MASWIGVITNAGNSLMANWAGGSVINIDKAVAGTGVVSSVSLLAQTDLVGEKQNASIVSIKVKNDNQKIKIQIAASEEGYLLNQIGLFASLDGSEPVLLALFQNETGIPIPSVSESPNFLYTFYGILKVSNQGEFSCTVDSEAYVSQSTLEEYVTAHADPRGAAAAQGEELKALIDALPQWAKQPNKPSYTPDEVGATQKGTAVTDSTAAAVKTVPETSAPYAEVKEIGGMTRKCTNLAKPLQQSTNGYTTTVASDGSIILSGAANAAVDTVITWVDPNPPIYINANEKCTISITKDGAIFDKLGTRFVYTDDVGGTIYGEGNQDVTRPRRLDKVYLQFTPEVGDTTYCGTYRVMINKGDTLLPYEPYFEGLRSAPVEEVESVGVNLIPYPYDDTNKTQYGITWTVNADGSVTANGTATDVSTFYLMKEASPKTLPAGKYFFDCGGENYSTYFGRFVLIHSDRSYSNCDDYGSGTNLTLNNGDNFYILLRVQRGITVSNITFYPMLNRGTTAQPYAPYVRNTLPIPEAVRNLDGYGWGINESVYNYVDWEKKQFVKRVGKRVFDGSDDELWRLNSDYPSENPCFYLTLKKMKSSVAISSHFEYCKSPYLKPIGTQGIFGWESSSTVIHFASSLPTIEEWRAYLPSLSAAGNPLTVYYELATPVITDVSDLLPNGAISVEGGGTVTMVNEFGYDVPNTVVFYEGTNEIIGADTLVGNLVGTASRAVCDSEGNKIDKTYLKQEKLPTSMPPTAHNQAASTITAGTFAGQVVANASGQPAGVSCVRNSKYSFDESVLPTVEGESVWYLE